MNNGAALSSFSVRSSSVLLHLARLPVPRSTTATWMIGPPAVWYSFSWRRASPASPLSHVLSTGIAPGTTKTTLAPPGHTGHDGAVREVTVTLSHMRMVSAERAGVIVPLHGLTRLAGANGASRALMAPGSAMTAAMPSNATAETGNKPHLFMSTPLIYARMVRNRVHWYPQVRPRLYCQGAITYAGTQQGPASSSRSYQPIAVGVTSSRARPT